MFPYSLFAAVLATIAAGLSSLVDEDGLEPRSLRDLARSIDTSDVPMNAERRLEMMAGAQRMAHELKEQLESRTATAERLSITPHSLACPPSWKGS